MNMEPAAQTCVGIPAAAILLEEASHRQPADVAQGVAILRTAIADAFARMMRPATGDVPPVTIVVAGPDVQVMTAPVASLRPVGLYITSDVVAAPIDDLACAAQVGATQVTALTGDAAIMALQVQKGLGSAVPVRVLAVPGDLPESRLNAITDSLVHQVPGHVVVASDLAATLDETSPGYLVPGADNWDQAIIACLDAPADVRERVLAESGPADADHFVARGWMPLRILSRVAALGDQALAVLAYQSPRGVGQVVVGPTR